MDVLEDEMPGDASVQRGNLGVVQNAEKLLQSLADASLRLQTAMHDVPRLLHDAHLVGAKERTVRSLAVGHLALHHLVIDAPDVLEGPRKACFMVEGIPIRGARPVAERTRTCNAHLGTRNLAERIPLMRQRIV